MNFKEWVHLEWQSSGGGYKSYTNFISAALDDKHFPSNIKTLSVLGGYLKRRGYGVVLKEQARECFKAWQSFERRPIDGFSPKDKERIRKATRQVWSWSTPRKLCIERCTDDEGFVYCENKKCKSKGKPVPRIHVDHINAVGAVDGGYFDRLFCPSTKLQGLCKKCHDKKTNEERAMAKNNQGVVFMPADQLIRHKGNCVSVKPDTPKKKPQSFTDLY